VITLLTALVALALTAITLAGGELSAPPTWLAALVLVLPYLHGVAIAWCFVLWSALPDRRSAPVMLTALVVVASGHWGPSWPARVSAQSGGAPLRVMTWNVQRLWGEASTGDPASCVAEAIAEVEPDVLTLLEISKAQTTALAAELDMSCVHTNYTSAGGTKRGGMATCVRGDQWSLKAGGAQRFVDQEDWFYLLSEIQAAPPDGQVVNLVAVHLTPYPLSVRDLGRGLASLARGEPAPLRDLTRSGAQATRAQSDQSAALLARVGRLSDPTLLAGDFNSTRDAALHRELRSTLTDVWEHGGQGMGSTVDLLDLLPIRVDYLYATGDFEVAGAQVPDLGCSDHRPVVGQLALRQRGLH
jgi:endonuclease/exonuclease/phosphatase (EEP) superfamily protein YafD